MVSRCAFDLLYCFCWILGTLTFCDCGGWPYKRGNQSLRLVFLRILYREQSNRDQNYSKEGYCDQWQVFFVVWWLSTVWFSCWVLNKGRVHNWFRMPCDLPRATVVNVWAKDQREVLSVNVFFLVRVLQRVKVWLLTSTITEFRINELPKWLYS